jgi:CRP/FNR family transcriptional regulator
MAVDLSVFHDTTTFRHLGAGDWSALGQAFCQVDVPAGSAIFREGDPGDGFYLVRSGHVKIRRMVKAEGRDDPQEQLLTVLDAGQLFGEMALVDRYARSADALSEDGATLYHLSSADLEELKKAHPATALKLQDLLVVTLCGRLRAANKNFEIIKFWLS